MNSFLNDFQGEIVRRPQGWRGVLHPSLPQRRSDPPALPKEKELAEAPLSPPAPPLKLAASKNFLSSVRMRLVGTIFVAIVPPLAVMYYFHLENWAGFLVGLVSLAAAWYGGERFIMRQLRILLSTTQQLATGDLSTRTGIREAKGELAELAHIFDSMAESLQQRERERVETEKLLLSRAQQQTVVAALGQFAMVSQDFNGLLTQALQFTSQILETPFIHVLELQPDQQSLWLRAGLGWKSGRVGSDIIEAGGRSQAAFVLNSGEPVIIPDMRQENRFIASRLLLDHGIVSGICVVIAMRNQPYGVLGVYSAKSRVYTEDEVQFLLAIANALGTAADRLRTENELQKLAAFAQLNPNPAMELTPAGAITYFNDTALRLAHSVDQDHPRGILPPNVTEIVNACLAEGQSRMHHETKLAGRTLEWSFHPVPANRVVHCYVDDVTERLSLESQLRQSQKMESVGQLAAGVAHDFNNMLTIIQGHIGMLMARPGMAAQALDSAQAIFFAAERAASLTRQLLMFSRKNVMQLKLLDLSEVVFHLSKMLRRLLGETITLNFTPPTRLPFIRGDSGMIEQVIMNLCVNARDAMDKGGTLTVSLSGIDIAADYAQMHPESHVGPHVCLCVTDTGCGMDTYIIGRIFEPFFTTKEVGKGTGLGLATVYGIVKQHGGWVEVSSKAGSGTTFNVFLPASAETTKPVSEDPAPHGPVTGGKETILVVEDEPVLREMAQLILEECGYQVFVAANGRDAIELWDRHPNSVDLLFTDMVMPAGVSGVELASKLLGNRPPLRVVFASGYTVDDISTDFLERHNDARFLQKPYNRATLARAVRESLDKVGSQQKTVRSVMA